MDTNKVATFLADEAMYELVQAIDEVKNIRVSCFRNDIEPEKRELDITVLREHLDSAVKYIALIQN